MISLLLLLNFGDIPIVNESRFSKRVMIEYVANGMSFNPRLAFSIAVAESELYQRAISKSGARGMFQILNRYESYLSRIAGIKNFQWDNPTHSAIVGIAYLKKLQIMYGHDRHFVAAYNCGPGRVNRMIVYNEKIPDETIEYVERVFQMLSGSV